MASYKDDDYTDDEDFSNNEEDSASGVIEDSISENSHEDSEDSNNEISRSVNTSGAVKRFTNARRSSHRKENDLIISDSDGSTDFESHNIKKTNFTRSSKVVPHSDFTSDSSENEEAPIKYETSPSVVNKSIMLKDLSHSSKKLSFNRSRNVPQIESNSDDTDDDFGKNVNTKKKRNLILSDSNSEPEVAEPDIHDSTTSEELSLHSIEHSHYEGDIENLTEKLNNSRLSNEFGKEGNIINSTLLETENGYRTPKLAKNKRSLNKSVETPRILKQMKESTTPGNSPLYKNLMAMNATESKVNPLLTPRNVTEMIPSRSPSPSTSVEIVSEDDDDVIDVSSEDPVEPVRRVVPVPAKKIVRQTTLGFMINKNVPKPDVQDAVKSNVDSPDVINVSPSELQKQKEKIRAIETDLLKAKNLLRTVNLESLPDKGKLIQERHASIEKMLKLESEKLSKMLVTKEDSPEMRLQNQNKGPISWDELEAKAGAVLPKTFGKQALSTYNAQKAVTMDRLQQLHGSLESCPKEDTLAEDPKGLKVQLMPHQKRALAWLMWRENQKPSGGILADDMGLGKTLTMISVMLKSKEIEDSEDVNSDEENQPQRASDKYKGGTLVVCPASLINQWSGELEKRTRRGLASYELYHGPKRETKAKRLGNNLSTSDNFSCRLERVTSQPLNDPIYQGQRLAEYDMVITTYAIVMNECEKNGAIFHIKWRRIVIDEAHQIRNHKSLTSTAIFQLAAKSRWALTGTPVHNKELDMYSLLKFLRCTPFDDLQVWKRWVGDKSTGGQERLHTVISSLMLRRTKAELMEKGALNCMPERKWELISVELNKNEMNVYQKILIFSRTLFAQFLHQRAVKNQDVVDLKYGNFDHQPNGPNQEYFKMRQKLLHLNKVKEIKGHEILVLLLRLRQICCHPSLIIGMLDENMDELESDEEKPSEELNLLDQLNNLALDDDDDEHKPNTSNLEINQGEAPGLGQAAKGFLNPSNPVFLKERLSSKIKSMLGILQERVLGKDDKAIIVSQWPSFLNLIAHHLKEHHIQYDQLDGKVPVNKRMVMVDRFNDPKDKLKILLLSLTAGGVGLNLVGANHLFLLDLHWNPQLENQAQDRIYRVGQHKPVFVYKFMAVDTIEKRILDLQEKKLDIANSMLTGSKQAIESKLSLQDLKLLFDM